jgi:predicted transposase YbfD/YdcC
MPLPPILGEHFATLVDPRVTRCRRYELHDILLLTLCATLCAAEGPVAIAEWAAAKKQWLEEKHGYEGEIPSHDTIGRLFAALDPVAFSQCFLSWANSLFTREQREVIAVDGKTLRHSFDTHEEQSPIHMVSAWAAASRLVLGQIKVDEKSNEITALPALLELLDLTDTIVTADALHCQKEVARQIQAQGAEYVLMVKKNQKALHQELEEYFSIVAADRQWAETPGYCQSLEKGHGRIEQRRCFSVSELCWFTQAKKWPGVKSVALVERRCIEGGKETIEQRYVISSLCGQGPEGAAQIAGALRSHWGIENSLHWVLDVQMREDDSRIRKDHSPTNFATIRHLALNLLRQDRSSKCGIKLRQLRAGWDEAYLETLLNMR